MNVLIRLAFYVSLCDLKSDTYHVATFYRMMRQNQKHVILVFMITT